jgi:serine/threonine protein kinase
MIGKIISHYKILEKLGEGGMGVVYRAEDTKLKRAVALKFLPPGLDAHEPERARFLQEAQAAAALNHPNICTIHDVASENNQQFIVMEYVEGKTLKQMVPVQKIQDAIGYAIQIGEALQEAHNHGVVHRDIKTENIMVNAKNQIKVMDFGLAKLKGSLKLTKTSSTAGTLAYMSPEQIQGGAVDARSDIFSFGVVLYEMLAGHTPFRGEYEAAMMYSIMNEEPEPIQKHLPEISSELVHILNRALEKNPDDRYQTVQEMVIDLRRAKKETSRVSRPLVPATPDSRDHVQATGKAAPTGSIARSPRRPAWIASIAFFITTVAVVLFVLRGAVVPKLNPGLSMRTLEIPFSQINYPCLSRDGNWIAFSAVDPNNQVGLYFMNVAKGEPRRLTPEPLSWIGYTSISPDGSEVLYDCVPADDKQTGIYAVSSLGGASRKIALPGNIGKWRPDGGRIGYYLRKNSQRREFWTVQSDGTDPKLEFVDSLSYGMYGNFCYDWSPDGKSIAWLRMYGGYTEIVIRDLESGRERQLTRYHRLVDEIAWATNGQLFFTSNKGGNLNIWTIPAKGGEAVQVTKGGGPDLMLQLSADCKRLLYLERRTIGNVWTVGVDGRDARQLTHDSQPYTSPNFSPDGRQIAFDTVDPGVGQSCQIFVMRSDGTDRIQLTSGEDVSAQATWSPDGKWMTYCVRRISEPWDSSRICLIEAMNPGTAQFMGKGVAANWIDAERFVVTHITWHSSLYSIHPLALIEDYEHRTWQFPLPDKRHILVGDMRKDRWGWWLKTVGSRGDPKILLPAERFAYAYPSVSLRYLLYLNEKNEAWRMALPDGRRERLPKILDGINPYAAEFQTSWDDEQVVFTKRRLDSRVVLVENLFK